MFPKTPELCPVVYRRGDAYVVVPSRAEADAYSGREGGLPEAPLIDWALTLMPEGRPGVFMDIGAHCGTWSTTFAAAGHHVVAFEPNPQLNACLRAGLALSDRANRAKIYSCALGAVDGRAELQWPEDNWWWGGGGSIVVKHKKALAGAVEVDVNTLDYTYTGLWPNLVKLDVEGAELDVLRGALSLFRRSRPKIIFECWDEEHGQRKEDLFAFLGTTLRYEVTPVSWPETYLATPRSN